jgi:hypothetical protein
LFYVFVEEFEVEFGQVLHQFIGEGCDFHGEFLDDALE